MKMDIWGSRCISGDGGIYEELSHYDDWEGLVSCSECGQRRPRYEEIAPQNDVITLVTWDLGDWQALFLGQQKVDEDHRIFMNERLLNRLGYEIQKYEVRDEDGVLCQKYETLDGLIAAARARNFLVS